MKIKSLPSAFIAFFRNSFFAEQHNWILWIPVIFAAGIGYYFLFPSAFTWFPSLILLLGSIIGAFVYRRQLIALIFLAIVFFLSGFLWSAFYSQKINYTPQIDAPIYAEAQGKIESIKIYHNNITQRPFFRVVLRDLQLSKVDFAKAQKQAHLKAEKKKKERAAKKKKSKNKVKKRRKKSHKKTSKHSVGAEEKKSDTRSESTKKAPPLTKTMLKNYANLSNYQEIDRELSTPNFAAAQKHWRGNIYLDPPRKITINVNTNFGNAKIGDTIRTNVFLEPLPKNNIIGGYDFARDALFRGIGGNGYATSDVEILNKKPTSNLLQLIDSWRYQIASRMLQNNDRDQAGVIIAIIVGLRDFMSPGLNVNIQNSGLAHLLSISGLHLTLATMVFFVASRFLLSLNSYLALNYNIKKIAAFLAILSGFFYLLLSGSPVPAVRSAVAVGLIFLAIIFDERHHPLRSIAIAALIILVINPQLLFSISFQLSFVAIIALAASYNSKLAMNSEKEKPFYIKFLLYFYGIVLSSLIAGAATTPLVIYYFNNYAQYSILANLIAIPITSFIVMPFGFLALVLMPLHLESLVLKIALFGADLIIKTTEFIATLPLHFLTIQSMPLISINLMVFGFLWICLWQKNWRFLGIIPLLFGIYLAWQNPLPNLLIDGDRKFFAIYSEKGMLFSKKTRGQQAIDWLRKMGETEFKNIDDLDEIEKKRRQIFCSQQNCRLKINGHSILILTERSHIDFICRADVNIIVNMTKYQLPSCLIDPITGKLTDNRKIIINNRDLAHRGSHFLYLSPQKKPRVVSIVEQI